MIITSEMKTFFMLSGFSIKKYLFEEFDFEVRYERYHVYHNGLLVGTATSQILAWHMIYEMITSDPLQ